MANSIVRLPLGYFPDPDRGRPLFNAQIWVGEPDTLPANIPANQKLVTGRQEDGTEVPLAQPIRTSAGGIPVDADGNYVTLLVDGAYSMRVDDRNDNQVYYFANVVDGAPLTFEQVSTDDILSDALVTATGTTTPRTLGDRFADAVNVMDFGAVGDGVTDDTAAFTNAAQEGDIYVPAGHTYILDGFSTIGSIHSNGAVLKWKAGVSGIVPMVTTGYNSQIQGVTFDGNYSNNGGITQLDRYMVKVGGKFNNFSDCIFINVPSSCVGSANSDDYSDCIFNNCTFKNTNRYCLLIRSSRWQVTGCRFFGTGINGGHAIRFGTLTGDPRTTVDGGVVSGCSFKYVNATAVLVELDARGITINGNNISFCSGTIKVESDVGEEGEGVVFSGNYVEYTKEVIAYDPVTETATLTGVENSQSSVAGFNCSVVGNIFYEHQGFTVGNGTLISDNRFIDSGTVFNNSLIQSQEAGGAIISGNSFEMDGTTAITEVLELVDYGGNQVTNNRFLNGGAISRAVRISKDNDFIKDNYFEGFPLAVSFVSSCTYTTLQGNKCVDCAAIHTANQDTVTHSIRGNTSNNSLDGGYTAAVDILAGVVQIGAGIDSVQIDTEGEAPTDDVDTIQGGVRNQVITVYQKSSVRDITFKNATGNLLLQSDYTMTNNTKSLTLIYNGNDWIELGRAN